MVQQASYRRFLQEDKAPDQRDPTLGLEALMKEVFPIVSYDETMQIDYLDYKLEEARYTPDECRELRLTYGMPFRIGVRLSRQDNPNLVDEEIYLGELPILMGGGEFIINGAERVIVNQLHRSPGVDFSIASKEADRPLHSARIIPERGSWIELEVSKKDVLQMRIDQSDQDPRDHLPAGPGRGLLHHREADRGLLRDRVHQGHRPHRGPLGRQGGHRRGHRRGVAPDRRPRGRPARRDRRQRT